jgi:hypothetical protein
MKVQMPSLTGRTIEDEEPARRAVGQGMLGDLRLGKNVIEV